MAPGAEAAQHTSSAHIAFASQSPFRRRPPSSARRADRRRCFTSIHVRALAARASRCFLIGGIDGTYTRTAVAARIKVARVVIGISDAVEKSSRSAGLTLLVARKGAVAETRKLIALNAKRITASDGPGRRAAKHGQSTRRQHGQNRITHESLLIDSLKQPKPSPWVPVNSRSCISAPLACFACDRLDAMVIVAEVPGPFARAHCRVETKRPPTEAALRSRCGRRLNVRCQWRQIG